MIVVIIGGNLSVPHAVADEEYDFHRVAGTDIRDEHPNNYRQCSQNGQDQVRNFTNRLFPTFTIYSPDDSNS